jgi:hypothetical protein
LEIEKAVQAVALTVSFNNMVGGNHFLFQSPFKEIGNKVEGDALLSPASVCNLWESAPRLSRP